MLRRELGLLCFMCDMEKEKDANSPIGVLQDFFRSSDSDHSSSSSTTLDDNNSAVAHEPSRWRGFFRLLRNKSKKSFAPLHPLKLSKSMSSSWRADSVSDCLKPPWMTFTLHDLQTATNNFSQGLYNNSFCFHRV